MNRSTEKGSGTAQRFRSPFHYPLRLKIKHAVGPQQSGKFQCHLQRQSRRFQFRRQYRINKVSKLRQEHQRSPNPIGGSIEENLHAGGIHKHVDSLAPAAVPPISPPQKGRFFFGWETGKLHALIQIADSRLVPLMTVFPVSQSIPPYRATPKLTRLRSTQRRAPGVDARVGLLLKLQPWAASKQSWQAAAAASAAILPPATMSVSRTRTTHSPGKPECPATASLADDSVSAESCDTDAPLPV